MREAAYETLTEEDRVLTHGLAGAWLEHAGESNGAVLAEHFERGREPVRARRWLLRAAQQAGDASDYEGAVAAVERAVALGAEGEELGTLRLHEARARGWLGDWQGTERAAQAAMDHLPRDGEGWEEAATRVTVAAVTLGHGERAVEMAEEVLAEARDTPLNVARVAHMATALLQAGHPELATRLLGLAERTPATEPQERAYVSAAHASQARVRGDAARYLALQRQALEAWEEAGDRRMACTGRLNVGYAYFRLGCYADAERYLSEVIERARPLALSHVATAARCNLGLVLISAGKPEEALRCETEAVQVFEAQGDRRLEGASRTCLARALLDLGRMDAAEQEARRAVTLLEKVAPLCPPALAVLAEVLLAKERPADALAPARQAAAALDVPGGMEEGEAHAGLTFARALDASGDRAAAREAIAAARARIEAHAAKISDPVLRRSFLDRVPEHAATFALAHAWLDAPA